MKIKCVCKWCGKERELYPSEIKRGKGKFCSRKCKEKWQSKYLKDKNHPLWKPKIKCICKQCGIGFSVKPSNIKEGGGNFCSPKCSQESRIKQIKCICKQCGIEFPACPSDIKYGKGKFCNRECRAKWQSENIRGKNHPSWKGGISLGKYCSKFNNEFKEYIRAKFGRICFLCSKTEEENRQRLSVHHVNYDKNCMCNDNLTCQFVPLCISCNAKVNKNRKEWELKIKAMMKNKLNGWYI